MPWASLIMFLSALRPGALEVGVGIRESNPGTTSGQSPEDSRNLPIQLHSSS